MNQDVYEVVYYRFQELYIQDFDSLESAIAFVHDGEDYDKFSTVGIFENSEPKIWDGYLSQDPPSAKLAIIMTDAYNEAVRKNA